MIAVCSMLSAPGVVGYLFTHVITLYLLFLYYDHTLEKIFIFFFSFHSIRYRLRTATFNFVTYISRTVSRFKTQMNLFLSRYLKWKYIE